VNIEHSSRNITPYAGLYFISDALNKLNISSFINSNLPKRSPNAKYKYSDIVLSLFANCMVQGERLSDLSIVKKKFSTKQGFKIPSADTVEYACQELKPLFCNETILNNKGQVIEHQHCFQPKMNSLLAATGLKTGLLKKGNQGYTLDFDHLVSPNEKQDAKMTYKQVKGYHPCLAFIGRLPVYIENHNGNSPARFNQKDSLQRCFGNISSQGLKIERFRGDSASCQLEVIEVVEAGARYFYIRMLSFGAIRESYSQIPENEWKKIKIGVQNVEVASINYSFKNSDKIYRLVVSRHLKEDHQMDIETGTAYTFQAIITNEFKESEQQVIEFYNQRGDAENSNRFMLNDFNMNNLPFMDMTTNTVYMYLTGLIAILFEYAKQLLINNKVEGIQACMRVKAICFHYIHVAGEWVKKKGQEILKIFSTKIYKPLQV
jgi:hypothetical protein